MNSRKGRSRDKKPSAGVKHQNKDKIGHAKQFWVPTEEPEAVLENWGGKDAAVNRRGNGPEYGAPGHRPVVLPTWQSTPDGSRR